jgi:prepilin-type N-terminal cleavage/methylation domain-containing protein
MKLKRQIRLLKDIGQNKSGFTLVELMVVVAIIGILVAIAVPIYINNTKASERAVVEANLRILDSAIMHYVAAEGAYPVNNNESGAMVWIIQNPSWNEGNALEPYVSPFSSIKGERYVIYGVASAPADAPISTNRAFIVLSVGETIGGHTATGAEHYHLHNLPWKNGAQPGGYEVVADDFLNWDKTVGNKNQLGFRISGSEKWGYTGSSKDVVIPSVLDGIILKGIWQDVFRNKGLTSIVFAEDSEINRIHGHAFRDNNLNEISFPKSLEIIDGNSFRNNQLQEIILPDSVTTVGQDAFRDNKINKIRIGNNVEIGNFAFQNNPVEEITIGEGVSLGNELIKQFSNEFRDSYQQGGAGTYKFIDGQWVKK